MDERPKRSMSIVDSLSISSLSIGLVPPMAESVNGRALLNLLIAAAEKAGRQIVSTLGDRPVDTDDAIWKGADDPV
ncbi:hypothetical protein KIPB_016282, partial [Kipferlia bialata]|eukprot:g16282.t1